MMRWYYACLGSAPSVFCGGSPFSFITSADSSEVFTLMLALLMA
jgi:hypothetical protein